MLSAAVTKVSKNRQVRRATLRNARASLAVSDSRPPESGARLIQNAIAGDAIQAITNGAARNQICRAKSALAIAARTPSARAPAMRRYRLATESSELGFACAAGTHSRRLRRVTKSRYSVRTIASLINAA